MSRVVNRALKRGVNRALNWVSKMEDFRSEFL